MSMRGERLLCWEGCDQLYSHLLHCMEGEKEKQEGVSGSSLFKDLQFISELEVKLNPPFNRGVHLQK